MQLIFGVSCIPVLSSTHTLLLKRLFECCHIDFSLEHEDQCSKVHLSIGQSLNRGRYGTWSFSCSNLRGLFKNYIAKCPTCLKSNIKSRDGQFSVILGNPRLASLVGQESPVFHTVSLDIQGPWIVSNFTGAKRTRNKHGSHKIYGLIIVDLLSGCFCIEFLNHASAEEVEAGLKSFSRLHRLPSKCIADAGSSLVSLEKNPLFTGIRRMGVRASS